MDVCHSKATTTKNNQRDDFGGEAAEKSLEARPNK